MTNSVRNRGKEASDDKLFSTQMRRPFQQALEDLYYLITKGYAEKSSLQLVGNRYRFTARQQKALQGMAAGRLQIDRRNQHEVFQLANQAVSIDGFNLLILLESALSGAYLFKGLDNSYRDLSGVHGTYKRVNQTDQAIKLVGETLKEMQVVKVNWWLDQPVSNSGRLLSKLYECSEENGWPWEVTLVYNPDKVLAESSDIVVSSDAWILDRAERWFNLGKVLLEKMKSKPQIFNWV